MYIVNEILSERQNRVYVYVRTVGMYQLALQSLKCMCVCMYVCNLYTLFYVRLLNASQTFGTKKELVSRLTQIDFNMTFDLINTSHSNHITGTQHTHIHTHIHTHTHTHSLTHIHTNTHTCTHTHIHTYSLTYTYIQTLTHAHMHTHTYSLTYTHTHTSNMLI